MNCERIILVMVRLSIRSFPPHKRRCITARLRDELKKLRPSDSLVESGFIAYDEKTRRTRIKTTRFLSRKLGLADMLPSEEIHRCADRINDMLYPELIDVRIDTGDAVAENYQREVGGQSCMTGDRYLVKLYADNDDRYSQLVMTLGDNSARAMVVKTDEGYIYMDRIYSDSDILIKKMVEYADSRDWLRYGADTPDLTVSELVYEDGCVPYQDTFEWGCIRDGRLTLSTAVQDDYYDYFPLDQTDGYLKMFRCTCCGNHLNCDEVCEFDGDYYCSFCFSSVVGICPHCGDCMLLTTSKKVDGTSVCEDCYKCLPLCKDCGEPAMPAKGREDEVVLCQDCAEHYICCVCGQWVGDIAYNDRRCADCAFDHTRAVLQTGWHKYAGIQC